MNKPRFSWTKVIGAKADAEAAAREYELARAQLVIRHSNARQAAHESKTYWLTWRQLCLFYRKNADQVMPHQCEFGHLNCSDKPIGICIFSAAMFEHMAFSESALVAALHDERIQELLGPAKAAEFYERMVQYDPNLWADINRELFSKRTYWDLEARYRAKVNGHAKEFIQLKGPCPMKRSDDPPRPPCPSF